LPTFIVISSSDSPQDKEAALQFGAARFFRKPADLDGFMQLGNVVKEVLNPHGGPYSQRLTA
jgi:CheY-like chemotaxis protein